MSNSNARSRVVSGRHIFAVLIAVFVIAGGIAAYHLITAERDYSTARVEYTELRRYAPSPEAIPTETEDTAEQPIQETKSDLSLINPDYVGWIRIDGTEIDYPVVQGADNDKYLNTTFTGERNPSGSIFMDAYSRNGFTFFTILHGHNMRDGSMFGGLYRYLDNSFRDSHREVTIFTDDNDILSYQIFAVKLSNTNDGVFTLPESGYDAISEYFGEFGFSLEDLQQSIDILVLATCTTGNSSERLLVFAARNRV